MQSREITSKNDGMKLHSLPDKIHCPKLGCMDTFVGKWTSAKHWSLTQDWLVFFVSEVKFSLTYFKTDPTVVVRLPRPCGNLQK